MDQQTNGVVESTQHTKFPLSPVEPLGDWMDPGADVWDANGPPKSAPVNSRWRVINRSGPTSIRPKKSSRGRGAKPRKLEISENFLVFLVSVEIT